MRASFTPVHSPPPPENNLAKMIFQRDKIYLEKILYNLACKTLTSRCCVKTAHSARQNPLLNIQSTHKIWHVLSWLTCRHLESQDFATRTGSNSVSNKIVAGFSLQCCVVAQLLQVYIRKKKKKLETTKIEFSFCIFLYLFFISFSFFSAAHIIEDKRLAEVQVLLPAVGLYGSLIDS